MRGLAIVSVLFVGAGACANGREAGSPADYAVAGTSPIAQVPPTTSAAPSSASPEAAPVSASSPGAAAVRVATECPGGPGVYLGFGGEGAPSPRLVEAIRQRFPDAIVVIAEPGKLGVITQEDYSVDARARHEAAARAVGWAGNVVDFPVVGADCSLVFLTPPPLPPP